MIAILRYAFLKNKRDGSLAAFLLGPIIMLSAPLLGVAAFLKGGPVYPLSLDPQWSAARTAANMAPAAMCAVAFFAALAGFWGFRSEIANRSIGSFVLAARPATIQTASALFGAAAGFAGYLGERPPHSSRSRVFSPLTPGTSCSTQQSCASVLRQSVPCWSRPFQSRG